MGAGSRRVGAWKISWPGSGLALHLAALADDGSIAPDPRRLARAHRAGLRPSSPWLVPATLCLALAAASRWLAPGSQEQWSARWVAALAGEPTALVPAVASAVMQVLAWSAGLVLVLALLGGGLGWVDARARRGLAVGPLRSGLRGALALIVPVVVAGLLAGVCAGAARAVDASEAGLWALYRAWSQRLLLGVGGGLLLVGLVDRALARRRLWRALHRTPGELRGDE